MSYDNVTVTLGATVGNGASFTVNYPTGRAADDYLGGTRHQITSQSFNTLQAPRDFIITPGASNITVTNRSNTILLTGTVLWISLDRSESTPGAETPILANPAVMSFPQLVRVNLRNPATASANAFVLSQACTLATGLATGINGALAAAGVGTNPVTPRNVVAAWTGTAVLTVTGTDEYGSVVRESSASGTSFTGKKAFKTITGVTTSSDITSLTVGTGVVLGLPVFLGDTAEVLAQIQDGVPATAGTIAAADVAVATATTGDVRGTYNPNSAPNGTRVFELILAARNSAYRGVAQFPS